MRVGKKTLCFLTILLSILLIAGCGGVYTKVKTPMPTLDMQINADSQERVGSASAEMFLWFFILGDCSTATAMKNGGITKIHHVDTEFQNIFFGIYGKFTTVVYGE